MSHLKQINSGYFKHLFYAMYFVFLALLVALTGFIHAIFPFIFEFTPYRIAKKITNKTEELFINGK